MIRVNKNFDEIPENLQNEYYNKQDLQNQLLDDGRQHRFNARIYNEAIIAKLRSLYHDKCAFCESKFNNELKHSFCEKATVEHYRPKSVYYWLGYEWSNLFLTCSVCNRHKGDKFELISLSNKLKNPPINENGRIDFARCRADSKALLDEEPCFLHPEVEKISFFTFNLAGEIIPISDLTDNERRRANYTKDKTKLNRWELTDARKRIIDDYYYTFLRCITLILSRYAPEEIEDRLLEVSFFHIFQKMLQAIQPESEYSLLGRELLFRFDVFFVNRLCEEIGEVASRLLKNAFELFLRNENIE